MIDVDNGIGARTPVHFRFMCQEFCCLCWMVAVLVKDLWLVWALFFVSSNVMCSVRHKWSVPYGMTCTCFPYCDCFVFIAVLVSFGNILVRATIYPRLELICYSLET